MFGTQKYHKCMTNAREEGKNDVDAVFVCFFVSARVLSSSLAYSYLCMRHQGCMADIGRAENKPSNDLNRVVPA